MNDLDIESSKDKVLVFFQRAQEVASTGNFDYAIDLYLEGIKRSPDALEDGHAPLRHTALLRQGDGGKSATMVDKLKHKGGKSPLERMLKAEYLLAKDPDNLSHAQDMLNACVDGGYLRTADWIGRLVFSACKGLEKPPISMLENLKNRFIQMGMYQQAVVCCAMVLKQKPDDHFWQSEHKNLSATATIQHGKYENSQKFTDSVQDNEAQQLIWKKDSKISDSDVKMIAAREAEKKFDKAPDSYANRIEYAQKLADVNNHEFTEKACGLLIEWFNQTNDFGYKKLHNEIVMKRLRDKLRHIRTEIETRGKSVELREQIRDAVRELADFEIEHFTDCISHYPTEAKYRYELGVRFMHKKAFDEAIPLFQQASKRPGLKVKSLNLLGMCFFNKSWYPDAIDVFETAIKLHVNEDEIYKELRYNLARACELDGRTERALTIYRKLAQIDYSYRDVAARVNRLRDV